MSSYCKPRWLVIYTCITVLCAGVAILIRFKSVHDYEAALTAYREIRAENADHSTQKLAGSLSEIYQNIRTISFLPSVRSLDRHGKNLAEDARQSIQQIYNNLSSSVAVSEVYIVPVDFDPTQMDPVTGNPEAPTLMFDVNEFADVASASPAEVEQEETEAAEYDLIVRQLDWLHRNCPTTNQIEGIKIPILSGPPIVTCDNTDFNRTLDDVDRLGLIFTVPIYDKAGKLHGCVSAILRTRLLQQLLPQEDAALIHRGHNWTLLSETPGQTENSKSALSECRPDETLAFSVVLPVAIQDPEGAWMLWTGRPLSEFTDSAEVKGIYQFAAGGYIGALLLWFSSLAICWYFQYNNLLLKQAEQDKRVSLQSLAKTFEHRIKSLTDALTGDTARLRHEAGKMAELVETSTVKAVSVASESHQATENIRSIANAVEQMSIASNEISNRTNDSSRVVSATVQQVGSAEASSKTLESVNKQIGDVIILIRTIAGQINLLSLNAAIEASRAGESGKGFAVVAHEVKVLANQTSDAANRVAQQILDVQNVSGSILNVFEEIRRSIQEVESASSTIAAAIEEQSATTCELSSAVSCFATGTTQITLDISEVMEASRQADCAARDVMQIVQNLSMETAKLEAEIAGFLSEIKPERSTVGKRHVRRRRKNAESSDCERSVDASRQRRFSIH
ncbi:MAG: methyl-accepting chemotaxis protein [Pirellulales bacterium]